MGNDYDGMKDLAMAVFRQAWFDAEGKRYGNDYEKKNPTIMCSARNWLMGRTKEDRKDQDFWNLYLNDERFIEETRIEARRRWAFGNNLPRKTKNIDCEELPEIPNELEPIDCSLHSFCEKKGIKYSKVYTFKRKYGLTNEQAVYCVLNRKEK